VPDRAGDGVQDLYGTIFGSGVVVDMIIQNTSAEGLTDLTFTVPR